MIFLKTNPGKIIFALTVLGLIGFSVYYFILRDDNDTSQEIVESVIKEDDDTPITDNSQFKDPEDVEKPKEDQPNKQPAPTVANVLEKPVIYTGYGNSLESPLGLEQNTSTTCTTDPGVDCKITFTKQSTGEVVTFDARETNNTGVAIWGWTGSEVGSGTWNVLGTAGNKKSDVGVIYIK